MLIYEPCEKYLTGTEVQNGSMVSCMVEWMRKRRIEQTANTLISSTYTELVG